MRYKKLAIHARAMTLRFQCPCMLPRERGWALRYAVENCLLVWIFIPKCMVLIQSSEGTKQNFLKEACWCAQKSNESLVTWTFKKKKKKALSDAVSIRLCPYWAMQKINLGRRSVQIFFFHPPTFPFSPGKPFLFLPLSVFSAHHCHYTFTFLFLGLYTILGSFTTPPLPHTHSTPTENCTAAPRSCFWCFWFLSLSCVASLLQYMTVLSSWAFLSYFCKRSAHWTSYSTVK